MLFWSPGTGRLPHRTVAAGASCPHSAPAWWWGHFLVLPALTSQHVLSPLRDGISLLAAGFICFLQIDLPKAHWRSCGGKNRSFQPNGGWLLWLNKGVGQVFVVWISLSEFTTCKPISLFQTNSSRRGCTPKLLFTAGEWEGWGTTEVPKCLIATNFNRSCPKWTSRDAYQRQTF